MTTSTADFQQLIAASVKNYREGSIVKGHILEKRPKEFLIDIGYKSEGVVSASEFDDPDEIQVGDEVEVLLERLENDQGMVILSKQKASQRQNWSKIVKLFEAEGIIKGRVKSVVKGGLIVNVGVEAFLPASQVDINPPKDLTSFVGNTYDFKIVKLNEDRKNVVLSRRELIEAERSERRQQFLGTMNAGDKVEGTVKNITDFGAFLDLDGIDGLLHITDMSWARLTHPSEAVKPGDRLTVVVLEINKDKERISLGLKQLQSNPWERIEERFPIGQKVKGKITNLMPYGAFVQIEEGIEGLIHVSELSWTKRITRPSDMVHVSDLSWNKKINHPSEILKKGDEVDAVVIDIDKANQRISLGVKQLETDPWKEIEGKYKVGDLVKGTVSKIANFGAFVELPGDIDGLVHISQISEDRVEKVKDVLKPGQEVEARVIKIDKTERRLGLSIKATGYSEEALRKESEALESVKSGEDMVSFGAALTAAEEEYRPGQGKK